MITWPDLVIAAVALLFALKGWKRGFVAEIGGFIALCAAIWAALHYPGVLDQAAIDYAHVGAGSAHVVGMVAFALIVYVALLVISAVLGGIAKLPVIGLGNAAGGAVVGIVKAAVGAFIVLYVTLFFPLPRDFHNDLQNSRAVALITAEMPYVDTVLRATMPWWVRPLVEPLFVRHHT